jgi:hypothetical protein|tara:strand:+ start:603 stop:1940 length:1338 start_codon:yes stop_codon:yes gene_type:complete
MPFHSNRSSGSSRFSARTGSTPNKKKKQKTIFGFKIGPPPKSDQQKRVERGATTIATKSGGKIVTTPTMDNKSLIMSKATQQKTKDEYLSSAQRLGDAKPAIGQAISGQATRLSQLSSKTGGTGGTPLTAKPKLDVAGAYASGKGMYKGPKQTAIADQALLTKNLKKPTYDRVKDYSEDYKSSVRPAIEKSLQNKATLLRGKITKSAGQFGSLQERTFLKTSTKAGRSVANPNIGTKVAKTLNKIGSSVKKFVDPLGQGMPKLGGGSGFANMPSGMSTPIDNIKTSTFFDSKTKTPTKTKKPPNIKMVTKNLPANYTVSSQKKSKPIPIKVVNTKAGQADKTKIKQDNVGVSLFRRVGGGVQASKFTELGKSQAVEGNLGKISTDFIRSLRNANTAELNAYMVPNVLKSYSKAEQNAIRKEFNRRQGNKKSKVPSLITGIAMGAL